MVWPMSTVVGVVVSVIATMALGMLWYSPVLFGNVWMRLQGLSLKDAKKAKGMAGTWLTAWIVQIVFAIALAHFVLLAPSLLLALGVSAVIWLGFVATTQLGMVLWHNQRIPVFLINTAYSLVSMLLTALIIHYLH